jgi:hypothetical protein
MSVDSDTEFIELCAPLSLNLSFNYAEIRIYISKLMTEFPVFEYGQVKRGKGNPVTGPGGPIGWVEV